MSDRLYWVQRSTRLEPGVTMSMWAICLTYEQALDQAVDAFDDDTVEEVAIHSRPANLLLPPTGGTPIWHRVRVTEKAYAPEHFAN